jgi:serine acetyltransferase
VSNFHTIVEDDARITYDSMVRAGVKIGENAVVGAKSTVQGDVPAHHIAVGSPATSVKIKPGWEDVADPLDAGGQSRRDERRIDYDLPEDLEQFDEFGRSRRPPGA